jgi:hypothetical protein
MLIRSAGVPPRFMIMSGPEARDPEDHDAPLAWRAPGEDLILFNLNKL